ncbi:M28 family peptidase [Candidatus Neomarinimicrobiota bacterium]
MRRYVTPFVIALLSFGWYGCEDVWNGNQPPAITSVTSTTAILDLPFSYTASAEDPDDDAVEFVYSGLPDWLVVDGSMVRGIPESTGTYQFHITAEDAEGEADQITVTIEVKSNASLLGEVVAAVSIDSLLETVNALSGNALLQIFDPPHYISTRVGIFLGNENAAEYLEWKLASFGLLAGRYNYSKTGSNVIALQQGSVYPDSIYIIGAHYDDANVPPDGRVSPGADDNASGVAAVIEVARILSQYTCRYTILYALWDEEETGLEGSEAYAAHTLDCEMKIAGVINLDMIAYDSNDDGAMVISKSYHGRSSQMGDQAAGMIELFDLALEPNINTDVIGSDNISFDALGYSTITIIEDIYTDINAYTHSREDTIDKFNNAYYHRMTKLAIATLAYLAGVESKGSLSPSTFWFCV